MKKVPLNSLVIMVGPSGAGKSTIVESKFEPYEVVSMDNIRHELVGDINRQDMNEHVVAEAHRRIALKLALGERVVYDATNVRKKERMAVTEIGLQAAVPIFYVVVNRSMEEKEATAGWRANVPNLIRKFENIFVEEEKDILRGDNIANVIDTRSTDFEAVKKINMHDPIASIKAAGFKGLMALGDVHGMKESLKAAIDWAVARNLFMVFLGDVLDYGPDSLECVDIVHDLVVRGKAIMVIGNHEKKIEKWFQQVEAGEVRLKLSEGNKATTNRVEQLSPLERAKFESKFKALMSLARNHWVIGDTLFTHGAAEPEMFSIRDARLFGRLESMALFGEIDPVNKFNSNGYPNRIYTWADRVPQGKRVIVGHDIRSYDYPVVVQNAIGGETVFLDTGSGKGGHLTTVHMLFNGSGLDVEAFTRH